MDTLCIGKGASLLLSTVIGVVLLFGCIYLGYQFPVLKLSKLTWDIIAFFSLHIPSIYYACMVATSAKRLPLFIPTICYMLAGSVIGILIVRPTMVIIVAVTSFSAKKVLKLNIFPMLFVIVACGAVSGFHFWLYQ